MRFAAIFALFFISGSLCLAQDSQLIIDPQPQQGRCFTVSVVSAESITKAEADFLSQKVRLYEDEGSLRAVLAVPPEQKIGEYALTVNLFKGGQAEKLETQVKILKTKFPRVAFRLKPTKHKLLASTALINEEWGRVEKVLQAEEPDKRWNGKFQLPVSQPVSMRFGTIERVNGRPRGQHRGLDLAAPMSTKVLAANNGKVVFAEKLKAFGGTLVIDYGRGVHSLYFHLSKFVANVGDEVSKGQLVALSGNSGISSGPHLHWGMSVHDVRVDPLQWVGYEF